MFQSVEPSKSHMVIGDDTSEYSFALRRGSGSFQVVDQVLGRSERKGKNRDGCCFIGTVRKNAGIADVEVGYVVRLAKSVGHKPLPIVSHSQSAGFMKTGAGHIRMLRRSQVFGAARSQ